MLEALPLKKINVGGRPYVRVTPSPLFDTEIIATATATTEVIGFSRPAGTNDGSGTLAPKNSSHTNLQSASQLNQPYAFDLFGFNVKITSNSNATRILEKDLDDVLLGTEAASGGALFEFKMGNRAYLSVPLTEIPHGVGVDGFSVVAGAGSERNGVAHRSNYYKFTVNKFLVHIRPSEAFNTRFFWPSTIKPSALVRLQMFMQGLYYNAI